MIDSHRGLVIETIEKDGLFNYRIFDLYTNRIVHEDKGFPLEFIAVRKAKMLIDTYEDIISNEFGIGYRPYILQPILLN